MREMKDSGIEWIGVIPQDWEIVRTKSLYCSAKEIAGDRADDFERLALTLNGVIKRSKEDSVGLQPEKFSGYQILKKGELVFKLIDLENVATSRVGLSPYTGIVSPAYIVLSKQSRAKDLVVRYSMYHFLSMWQREIFNQMGDNGVRSSLNAKDLLNIPHPFPSICEQKRIVTFLDAQCAEIDAVLEKTRASIEEYKKLKQAVITQAVTKGIRGDRPMKDSGIEWIGTCPLNWTVCRIKNVIFPQEKEVLPDDEIITCFRDGEVTLRKNRREDGFTVSFTEHGYHGVDKGDLVIHGMDAFAGAIGCSDSRGKTTPVVHTCKTAGNNRFFMYFLRSMAYGNILMDLSNGVRIRSSDFRNFAKLGVFGAVMPPLEEQNEIVDYIDGIVIQMDRLIQKKENLLTEIETYKKSLIYEYVTGKKEVV